MDEEAVYINNPLYIHIFIAIAPPIEDLLTRHLASAT